jgi:SAM-dependent methyltransferase
MELTDLPPTLKMSLEDNGGKNEIVEAAIRTGGASLIDRYNRKHNVSAAIVVTGAEIRQHYYTERACARAIRASTLEERSRTAKAAYDHFFASCPWLNTDHQDVAADPYEYSHFPGLLRRFGRKIYEVGSGSGALARYLSAAGFKVVTTEISSERETHYRDGDLEWHSTDGVVLSRFETPESYDIVLSTQVLEHFHPDDLPQHFAEACRILRHGGAYLFTTPNRLSGPHDVTLLFGMETSDCFHLKEYTHREMLPLLRAAGFKRVEAVYIAPKRLRHRLNLYFSSSLYLSFLRGFEWLLERLPYKLRRKVLALLFKVAVWRSDVTIIAFKP